MEVSVIKGLLDGKLMDCLGFKIQNETLCALSMCLPNYPALLSGGYL